MEAQFLNGGEKDLKILIDKKKWSGTFWWKTINNTDGADFYFMITGLLDLLVMGKCIHKSNHFYGNIYGLHKVCK